MTALVAIVAALAVYRLALLATADEITKPMRQRALDALRTYEHTHVVTFTQADDEDHPTAAHCSCGQGWKTYIVDDEAEYPDVRPFVEEHLAEHDDVTIASESKWAYLLTCPWCVSVWIAAPVVWSSWCFGDRAWWFVPAGVLAASAFAGAASQHAAP